MARDEPVAFDELARWIRRGTEGCTELDRLALAVKVGHFLNEMGDRLVGEFVEEARRAGVSWSQIGAQIGVTKQAAHQRHEARRKRRPFGLRRAGRGWGDREAFERFTAAARRCIELAQAEAHGLDHGYVGTEHLLLGVVSELTGVGGVVLRGASVTADGVRDRIVAIIGRGTETPAGAIPFTPRSKRALEIAVREAGRAGQDPVGTGWLTVGILADTQGVAVQALRGLGIDAGAITGRIRQALGEQQDT